jgi:hypothetical protein
LGIVIPDNLFIKKIFEDFYVLFHGFIFAHGKNTNNDGVSYAALIIRGSIFLRIMIRYYYALFSLGVNEKF